MKRARFHSRPSVAVSVLVPLGLVALTVLVGSVGTPAFQDTVTLILCNLTVVLGLQVFIGNSGVYSFGQAGFAMAGAYLAALLTLPAAFALLQTPGLPDFIAGAQLGPFSSTLIAAVFSGLLAAVVGLPLMRTSTLAIPISTFAFLIVAYNVVANWDQVTGGSSGLLVPDDDQRRVGRPLGGRGHRHRSGLQVVGERLPPAGNPRRRGRRPLDRDRRDERATARPSRSAGCCAGSAGRSRCTSPASSTPPPSTSARP